MFKNPILPGFYPDPSICRVDSDYYLVTSTFAYFPGVPVFHSRDLINWEQIGNALDRRDQLDLTDCAVSQGIFAPTIRYFNGTYYIVTTNVTHGGNFVVTADNPAGPWSPPHFLDAKGIDPSLFFDDDGKCYYVGAWERREGGAYYGDNEIFIQELDLRRMKLIGESRAIWHGALKNAVWPESPHLYKKDGLYYLMIAEGGTDFEHAVTIARSESLNQEFTGSLCNPILTHRHLGRSCPIVNVGHGDLVETQNGEWFMVVLASRPYGGYYRNLGRETFLVPVTWENGWPVVNYGIGMVRLEEESPNLHPVKFSVSDAHMRFEFDSEALPPCWMFLRNPSAENFRLEYSRLKLKAASCTLSETGEISYVCVRQRHMSFSAGTCMEFAPRTDGECAGMALLQNEKHYYTFTYTRNGEANVLRVTMCSGGSGSVLAELRVEHERLYLRITADYQSLSFFYSVDGAQYNVLLENADARILSTDISGGFVGTTIGLYAASPHAKSGNEAAFDWFEYSGVE